MSGLLSIGKQLERSTELCSVIENIKQGVKQQIVCGLNDNIRDVFIVYQQQLNFKYRPLILIAEDDYKARCWQKQLQQLTDEQDVKILLFPALEMAYFNVYGRSREFIIQRLRVLYSLSRGQCDIIITSFEAMSRKMIAKSKYYDSFIELKINQTIEPSKIKNRLINIGYERVDMIEGPGQFSIKGSIIDIFSPADNHPLRIELFDDLVDGIRKFDVESQRSLETLNMALISPAVEIILSEEAIICGSKRLKQSFQKQVQLLLKNGNRAAAENCNRQKNTLFEQIENGLLTGQNAEDYLSYFITGESNFLDYIPQDSLIFVNEPLRVQEIASAIVKERNNIFSEMILQGKALPEQAKNFLNFNQWEELLKNKQIVWFSLLPRRPSFVRSSVIVNLQTGRSVSFNGNWANIKQEIINWRNYNYAITIVAANKETAKWLVEYLNEEEIGAYFTDKLERRLEPGELAVITGNIEKGFELISDRFILITEKDLHGSRHKRSGEYLGQIKGKSVEQKNEWEKLKEETKNKKPGKQIIQFSDIRPGDYVVHSVHGVGRYLGIETMKIDNVHRDYLAIQYAGSDRLYVPTYQMELIQKYVSSEGMTPRLSRLGGNEWSRTVKRVKESLREMADELVKLYAAREKIQGCSFAEDTAWEQEFAEDFLYKETADQIKAIEEIKADMMSPRPMDRLLCGDVGYGKTEVAMRAAFKAAVNGKQTLVLVPTTILAQQHYNNFIERFSNYPVKIEMVSRFRSVAERKKVFKMLEQGLVDIVIGTHCLFNSKLTIKDLGLLIIDEEQQFGVRHKEKLKQIRQNVDVLTLTATPIPRTLNMALTGIRNMSVLNTAPEDRIPVRTFVVEEDFNILCEAIRRELSRGGQIYYVSNRINDIDKFSEQLMEIVPEAKIAVAHGRLSENLLEKIMLDFMQGNYDILLSTTIIENGLDIPNVNTLIVRNAQQLGLAQLYQLRGRVGRSSRQAYAYFTYQRDVVLKENAEKRLSAIREFTEFGSGFKIAMRDLEIRGSGNILGAEQHGHIAAVGFYTYSKLLEEAVQETKKEQEKHNDQDTQLKSLVKNRLKAEIIQIDLQIDAYLSADYISDNKQKIEIYQKIAAAQDEKDLMEVTDEILDRFGDLTQSANNLINIARIKLLCCAAGVKQITQRNSNIILTFSKQMIPTGEKLSAINIKYKNCKFEADDELKLSLRLTDLRGKSMLDGLKNLLDLLAN